MFQFYGSPKTDLPLLGSHFVAPFVSLIVTYSPTLAGALSLWHTSDAKTRKSAVFIATEEAMAKKSLVKASELVEHVIFV